MPSSSVHRRPPLQDEIPEKPERGEVVHRRLHVVFAHTELTS